MRAKVLSQTNVDFAIQSDALCIRAYNAHVTYAYRSPGSRRLVARYCKSPGIELDCSENRFTIESAMYTYGELDTHAQADEGFPGPLYMSAAPSPLARCMHHDGP